MAFRFLSDGFYTDEAENTRVVLDEGKETEEAAPPSGVTTAYYYQRMMAQ